MILFLLPLLHFMYNYFIMMNMFLFTEHSMRYNKTFIMNNNFMLYIVNSYQISLLVNMFLRYMSSYTYLLMLLTFMSLSFSLDMLYMSLLLLHYNIMSHILLVSHYMLLFHNIMH